MMAFTKLVDLEALVLHRLLVAAHSDITVNHDVVGFDDEKC